MGWQGRILSYLIAGGILAFLVIGLGLAVSAIYLALALEAGRTSIEELFTKADEAFAERFIEERMKFIESVNIRTSGRVL
ncbi:TPA: hypothetical protein EYP12_08035 [Candidatus Bipolaricaulota bacterium]|nr:hypothetical protein [Candidatus Bipolaricaulota bacterium]